jgi:hypothetical protein
MALGHQTNTAIFTVAGTGCMAALDARRWLEARLE